MADLNNDLRLAVDTGDVVIGSRAVAKAVSANKAKAVVVASKGRKEAVDDLVHACKIAEVKVIRFNGNSLDLGAVCGKPHSVNGLAIVEAGNSNILNEEYS